MPETPKLAPGDVAAILPNLENIEVVDRGGQKLVFKVRYLGEDYALKFALLPSELEDLQDTDVALRARREVEIMRTCASSHMVKLGPLGLDFVTAGDQHLL